jgi:hypothetical protein
MGREQRREHARRMVAAGVDRSATSGGLDRPVEAPMSFLRQLVQSTLRPSKRPSSHSDGELEVGLFGGAAVPGARAVAYGGQGLDLAGGECVLAAIGSHAEPQGFHHRLGVAITNRRTIYGGWSSIKGNYNDVRATVMHEEVVGLDMKKSLVSLKFDVLTPRGPQNLVHFFAKVPEAEAFFRGLAQIPFGHRAEPALPLVAPSSGDPIGAHAALASLWYQDDRASAMIGALHHVFERGAIDPGTAVDLIGRVLLAHRAVPSGPAGWGNGFLSPICADDLGHVLCGALGQPLRYEQPQPGMHWLDFRYDPQRDTLSPALAALGIASFFALGIGFSPGRMIAAEMMRKQPLNVIRFAFADVQGGCAYEIYGNGRRIEPVEAELGHAFHQLLVHAAWPVLERRCYVA